MQGISGRNSQRAHLLRLLHRRENAFYWLRPSQYTRLGYVMGACVLRLRYVGSGVFAFCR